MDMNQVIRNCVAAIDRDEDGNVIKCGDECEPGYKYCEFHKDRPKAIEERKDKALRVLTGGASATKDDVDPDTGPVEIPQEMTKELEKVQPAGVMSNKSAQSVVDQVSGMLERVYDFSMVAFKAYSAIDPDDWSFTDKAGTAQLRPEVSVYERALDRETRVIPQIAKLGLDQQRAVIEKAQFEGIKAAMTRTFIRMGMNQKQMDEANRIIAEEFSRMTA